jgi:hypothetical protein
MRVTPLSRASARWPTALGWLALACLAAAAGAAVPMVVPSDLQAAIFSRVLAYDRALKSRAGKTVTIGVVFVSSEPESKRVRHDMMQSFGDLEPEIQGLPTRLVSHPYSDMKHFSDWIDEADVDVLYVTPGFGGLLNDLKTVVNDKKLVTLTPVREYVEQGLAIAVVPRGNHPQLVVNLTASRAAGMDLDPKALQLSEILK